MRRLLGIGARAEVVRYLLSAEPPRSTASVIAQSATYTKRNVQEALYELEQAGVITVVNVGYDARYGIEHARWAELLEVEGGFPMHMDWVQVLRAIGKVLRWLRDDENTDTSDYLQASGAPRARELIEDVRADLEWAGVLPRESTASEALASLEDVIDQSLAHLAT